MDTNWHKAGIITALHKKRMSLAELSREAGLSFSTLGNALERPWSKREIIIAKAIGIPPEVIWPERYYKGGEFINRYELVRKFGTQV